jgi:hypothetical protein
MHKMACGNSRTYEGWHKSNIFNFFQKMWLKYQWNLLGWCIHICNCEAIFPQSLCYFHTLLPTLSKTLYTSVVKFPASTLDHITKSLFQYFIICKMVST